MKKGYKYILTVRNYDAILGVMKRLKQEYYLVGEYGGKKLIGKLKASLEKTFNIIKLFEEKDLKPDVAVHYASPEAARVAYGLGMPNISFDDAPHSIPPLKLAVSLSDYLLTPRFFPKEFFTRYISPEKIIQYNSVDEVEWITYLKPDPSVIKRMGLENEEYIIFRPEESFASYYLKYSSGEPIWIGKKILKHILEKFREYKILALPRYNEQAEALRKMDSKRIIIPREHVLTIDILQNAKMLITGGGTMAREAALYGIPSLTYFPRPLYLECALSVYDIPLRHIPNIQKALEYLDDVLKNPDRHRVNMGELLRKFELPSNKLLELFRSL